MTEHERTTAPSFELRDHNLDYFPDLRVGKELFTRRFASGCSMMNCSAACCREGVIVDVTHRDHVLANIPLVLRYMDATQDHDSSRWFEDEEYEDPDFPSGRVCNTRVFNRTCVFLDSERRCVLQRAEAETPGLKPFYCRTYPIVIVESRLTLDYQHCPEETQCCGTVEDGPLTALDTCAFELEFMLGPASKGLVELRKLEQEVTAPQTQEGEPSSVSQ